MTRTYHPRPELQIRLVAGYEVVFGPGKAALLEAIASSGSIRAAATQLDLSYKKAWQLLATMNDCLPQPAVATEVGGNRRGGAQVTDFGRDLLRRYRAIEALIAPTACADAEALLSWATAAEPGPEGD